MSLLDHPMVVVTTRAGNERAGCLVGFATQVSIGPPRFLVGLSKRNRTYRAWRAGPEDIPILDAGGSSHSPMSAIWSPATRHNANPAFAVSLLGTVKQRICISPEDGHGGRDSF
jgi:hypothetical protein